MMGQLCAASSLLSLFVVTLFTGCNSKASSSMRGSAVHIVTTLETFCKNLIYPCIDVLERTEDDLERDMREAVELGTDKNGNNGVWPVILLR